MCYKILNSGCDGSTYDASLNYILTMCAECLLNVRGHVCPFFVQFCIIRVGQRYVTKGFLELLFIPSNNCYVNINQMIIF
jgi:hypothetical protein